jgi:hypothetical protein
VANVSHELKTPLTAVSGYAETLLDDGIPQEQRRKFVQTIHDNATRMQRIVDDLLDLSRIESGGWRPVVALVDVAGMVQDVFTAVQSAASAKGLALVAEVSPDATHVRVDPTAFRQILTNLVENAVRYTREGKRHRAHAKERRRRVGRRERHRDRNRRRASAAHLRAVLSRGRRAVARRRRHRARPGDRSASRRCARRPRRGFERRRPRDDDQRAAVGLTRPNGGRTVTNWRDSRRGGFRISFASEHLVATCFDGGASDPSDPVGDGIGGRKAALTGNVSLTTRQKFTLKCA